MADRLLYVSYFASRIDSDEQCWGWAIIGMSGKIMGEDDFNKICYGIQDAKKLKNVVPISWQFLEQAD